MAKNYYNFIIDYTIPRKYKEHLTAKEIESGWNSVSDESFDIASIPEQYSLKKERQFKLGSDTCKLIQYIYRQKKDIKGKTLRELDDVISGLYFDEETLKKELRYERQKTTENNILIGYKEGVFPYILKVSIKDIDGEIDKKVYKMKMILGEDKEYLDDELILEYLLDNITNPVIYERINKCKYLTASLDKIVKKNSYDREEWFENIINTFKYFDGTDPETAEEIRNGKLKRFAPIFEKLLKGDKDKVNYSNIRELYLQFKTEIREFKKLRDKFRVDVTEENQERKKNEEVEYLEASRNFTTANETVLNPNNVVMPNDMNNMSELHKEWSEEYTAPIEIISPIEVTELNAVGKDADYSMYVPEGDVKADEIALEKAEEAINPGIPLRPRPTIDIPDIKQQVVWDSMYGLGEQNKEKSMYPRR